MMVFEEIFPVFALPTLLGFDLETIDRFKAKVIAEFKWTA